MKSLILVCLSLLIADCFSKEIPGAPSQLDLDLDRLPINIAAAEGTEVILRCAAANNLPTHNVVWMEYVYNSLGSPISSNENIGAHPQRDRYTILHRDAFEYSLRIFPVLLMDGGHYECMDQFTNPIDKRSHHLSLTVVGSEANCTTTVRDSGVVLEDSYQTNDCQLEYKGNIIPNMTWVGPGIYSQRYIATDTVVWVGMQYNVTRQQNGALFQAVTEFTDYFLPVPANSADNVPDYRRVDQSQELKVQWGPKNMVVVPVKQFYDVGDILTCTADGNPAPSYFWQNLRTNDVIIGNQVIVLPEWQGTNQTMRCDARNTIEEVTYSGNILQIVTVNPDTTPTTTTPGTTTTLPPPVSPCNDLTGGWESTSPTHGALCILLDTENNGALRGLLRNESDTYWVDIVGRAQATKYDQLGFNGIWPAEFGVSSFIGECHRCHGLEQLLVNVVSRSKSSQCGTGGPIRYTTQYTFYRSLEVPCPNLPQVSPNLA